jgi:hypothetical protein
MDMPCNARWAQTRPPRSSCSSSSCQVFSRSEMSVPRVRKVSVSVATSGTYRVREAVGERGHHPYQAARQLGVEGAPTHRARRRPS